MSADPAAADGFDAETTAKALNMRTGPGVAHEVVSVLPNGTRVSILEINDGWARVTAENHDGRVHGWVSGKYLEIYEIALPRVASAGVDDMEGEEIPPLSQPKDEVAAVVAPTEPVTTDDATAVVEPTETVVVDDPTTELLVAEEAVVEEPQEMARLAEENEAERLPLQSKPDQPVVVVPELQEKTIEQEPVRVGSLEPAASLPLPEPVRTVEPLSYEALDISCRQGYFSTGLDACTADIKVDVTVPEGFADLVSDALNVKCVVGFSYESDGIVRSETMNEAVKVAIVDGRGSAVFQSRIDFLFRVDNVTRVEVTELDCGGASSLN